MPTYTYTTLDDPSAAEGTFAYGINNSGQIVGYYQDSNLNKLGFVYSSGAFTPFNVAQAINDAGQIVGLSGDGFSSFLYSAGNYASIYDPSAYSKTLAQGINGGGQVVGWYDTGLGALGFLYSGGNYTTIKDPLGDSTSRPFGFPITVNHTYAHGINDAGQIVGGYQGDSGNNGFLYSGGNYTTLKDPLSVDGTVAEGINNAGQIVGYYLDSSQVAHAFLYSGGTYTTIDDPLGTKGTVAQGINDAGQIVGYYIDSGANTHGFTLTIAPNPPAPAGMKRGHDSAPRVRRPLPNLRHRQQLDAGGLFLGAGRNRLGVRHAWRLFRQRYDRHAVAQDHVVFAAATEIAEAHDLPIETHGAEEGGAGDVIGDVVDLKAAGIGVAQQHVGGVGAVEAAERDETPIGSDPAQGIGRQDRAIADVVDPVLTRHAG